MRGFRMFCRPKKDELNEDFVAGVEKAINVALDDLEKMREDEGEILKKRIGFSTFGNRKSTSGNRIES